MIKEVQGLRTFLLATLKIMSSGETITCKTVEGHLSSGIATALFSKYEDLYKSCGFSADHLESVDAFYRISNGIADGREAIYACDENDGFQLVIALALNEIF